MNHLQIFVYSGEQLRTVQRDDGLWWVLRDVCRVLNIGNVFQFTPLRKGRQQNHTKSIVIFPQ